MSLPLFYLESVDDVDEHRRVVFAGENARHLARSVRAKVGDNVLVGDGLGTLSRARLTAVTKGEVLALVEGSARIEREVPAVTLFQGVSKPSSMDEAVYRAAETGIELLVPFITERSADVAARAAERGERWVRIAREASRVARRAWKMRVGALLPGPPREGELRGYGVAVVLWEDEREAALSQVLPTLPPPTVAIIAGPEGGLSMGDVEPMVAAGAVTASIGDLVLRAETAGPCAAMLVRYRYGLLVPGRDREYD